MGVRAAVAGASGYAGGELLRLLAGHPEFDLVAATAPPRPPAPGASLPPPLLALHPTLDVAAAGATGAGGSVRAPRPASEVMGELPTYKVGAHQPTAEIRQASGARTLSFTPTLAPMPRGILAAVPAVPTTAGVTADEVRAV